MNVKGIDLPKLRNAEFLQFSKDVLNIVNNNNTANALDVNSQYRDFENRTTEIDALFVQDQGSDITPLIEALDLRRDNAISGISLVVNALLLHFNPGVKAAAQKLSDHLQLYGSGIARQNYPAETASISSIISDWNSQAELTAAINTLGLTTWKDELNAANEAFNSQYLARTQEIGAQNPDRLREKREQSVQTYYVLRDRIVAFATINEGVDPWGKTVNELNALIEQYNVLLAGRATSDDSATAGAGA